MTFSIQSHQLHDDIQGGFVQQYRSPNCSRGLRPNGIILHDTAGRLTKYSSAKWLEEKQARASAHFIIERDGEIVQGVPLNLKAWHAGKSVYRGTRNCNDFTFGIEIVNPGKMVPLRGGVVGGRTWFGQKIYDDDLYELQEASTPEHGSGVWMHYTEEQIESVINVCNALVKEYGCTFIEAHWKISPGRKVDTNPLFPMDHVRSVVFGRDMMIEDYEIDGDYVICNANMRQWPHIDSHKLQTLPKNTAVEVIRSGWFNDGLGKDRNQWHLCSVGDVEGWIYGPLVDLN